VKRKNGREAVTMVKELQAAVFLMDVAMPLLDGLQSTRQTLKHARATKVLILSAHGNEEYVVEAVRSGAIGYLVKHTSVDCVCLAIR